MAQIVKSLPATWETQVRSLGQVDPLEKEMATHSNTLAWKSPWTEEPGGLQSLGCKESGIAEQLHFGKQAAPAPLKLREPLPLLPQGGSLPLPIQTFLNLASVLSLTNKASAKSESVTHGNRATVFLEQKELILLNIYLFVAFNSTRQTHPLGFYLPKNVLLMCFKSF